MMPEQIPDILADKGIQAEMEEWLDRQMQNRVACQSWNELQSSIRNLMKNAYKRALADGFRYGWTIANNRKRIV